MLYLIYEIFVLIIMFFVIRTAVRANQNTDLLIKIYESQSKMIKLLETMVKNKTSVIPDDNFYFQSDYLTQAQEMTVSELLTSDGSIDDDKVIKLTELYKNFRRDLVNKGYSLNIAIDIFEKVVDKIKVNLNEEQRIHFTKVYDDAKFNNE